MNSFKNFLTESQSSDEAHRLGLSYFGFGKYGKEGRVTHYVKNNQLVPFNPKNKNSMGDSEVTEQSLKKMHSDESKRVFRGEPVLIQSDISKQTTGAIGEHVVVAYLKMIGNADAAPMNSRQTNFPVDLICDHILVECKSGLVSNSKKAQHWRATIGQPGKKETEWLKTASKEEKAAWNARKNEEIMKRKYGVLKEMTQKYGVPIKAKTITTIINPDTHTVDIFVFDDFHQTIKWNSQMAKDAYVGTFSYET